MASLKLISISQTNYYWYKIFIFKIQSLVYFTFLDEIQRKIKMADDIDEIMAMIEGMQSPSEKKPMAESVLSEKENIRLDVIKQPKSANDELNSIMKSIEDIQNMPSVKG